MDDVIGKLVRFNALVPLLGLIIETNEHYGAAIRPGVKVLFSSLKGQPTRWYYFDTIRGTILANAIAGGTLGNIVSGS